MLFFSYYFHKIIKIAKIGVIIVTAYLLILSIFFKFNNSTTNKVDNFTQYEKYKKQEINAFVNNPDLKKTPEGRLSIKIYGSMICGLFGEECNNGKSEIQNFNRSFSGVITNLLVFPYDNPPSSGIQWAFNGLQNAGFIQKSYAAQGIGFASINVFAPIWKGFRNAAYLILVIILVAIGFMVMFRMKLNPQTVISVENALPKIVLTLILITFSFAIVGFLIDLMYIVTILSIDIIGTGAGVAETTDIQNRILTDNALFNADIFKVDVYFKGIAGLMGILPNALRVMLSMIISFITGLIALKLIGALSPIISDFLGKAAIGGSGGIVIANVSVELKMGTIIGIILAVILGLLAAPIFLWIIFLIVVFLGLIFLMFRIFLTLVTSLVMIILYIIFSPLLLLMEAIPGQSAFSSWLKTLVGNLIVFPTVAVLFLVIYAINKYIPVFPSSYIPGNSPPTPVFTPPLLAGIDSYALVAVINGSILLMIPDLVKMVKEKIAGKSPGLPIGPGLFFGGVGATAGTGLGLISQFGSLNLGVKALFGDKADPSGAAKSILGSLFRFGKKP